MHRSNANTIAPTWSRFLWGLALLGLLLLPSDFRAGAEAAHGHAMVHLWLDAADGAVHHHHAAGDLALHDAAWSWLEPTAAESARSETAPTGDARPDLVEHQDSTLAAAGAHLLNAPVTLFWIAAIRLVPPPARGTMPAGRAVRVPLPPPRVPLHAS